MARAFARRRRRRHSPRHDRGPGRSATAEPRPAGFEYVRRRASVPERGQRGGRSTRARARARVADRSTVAASSCSRAARRRCWWRRRRGVTLDDKIATGARAHARGRGDRRAELRAQAPLASERRSARGGGGATVTLAISDVHGPVADDPSVIGSGPTVARSDDVRGCAGDRSRRSMACPASVRRYLERGAAGEVRGDDQAGRSRVSPIASYDDHRQPSDGARRRAAAPPSRSAIASSRSIDVDRRARRATRHTRSSSTRAQSRRSRHVPLCVLGAGETTVTVTGHGLGGRNQEFALAAAPAIAALRAPAVLASAGTDGVDGPTDAAGAMADSTTLERARAARARLGVDAGR